MKGRLNLFQASMLRWRSLYPYTAVHVVRMAGALDPGRLQRAIDAQLAAFGLSELTVDYERQRFEYGGQRPASTITVLAGAGAADATLATEMERQLNEPFAAGDALDPFRFFVVDRGDSFDLGLGYDHFVAAGDSIVLLMKSIVARHDTGSAAAGRVVARAPDLYPPTYGRLLFANAGALIAGVRRIPAIVRRFRHAFRPRYPHGNDPWNAFTRLSIDPAGLARLRRATKAWGVTLNDLLLAMLLTALSPATDARRRESRRNELGVASIVNIRRDCGAEVAATFGQFLSSFLVTHPVPPGASLERIARDVHAETARIKGERLYLQTLVAMGVSGLVWRHLSAARRATFHGKAYPVWAGMTSVNVDALWAAPEGSTPPPYLRAVSTGPIAPLVVAVTTAGGVLELGLSYRTAAFTSAEMDKMTGHLLRCIESLPA